MNRRYSIPTVALIITILTIGLMLLMGCAQTRPIEEKEWGVKPEQTVISNNVTIISDDAMKMLIELSREDLEKAVQLLNRHGGIVLHMGAWGIKVEGIKASRTTTSEATSEQKADVSVIPK